MPTPEKLRRRIRSGGCIAYRGGSGTLHDLVDLGVNRSTIRVRPPAQELASGAAEGIAHPRPWWSDRKEGGAATCQTPLFAASLAHHLQAGYLKVAVLPLTGFLLFVRLAFFLLCCRSIGVKDASHGNSLADVIGKGDIAVLIELPMLVVGGDEKKSPGFKTFLKTTGYGLLGGRFLLRRLRCAIHRRRS